MNKKAKITIAIVVCAITFFFIWVGSNIYPGSYRNAERYELNMNDSNLILAIRKFKNDSPQYKVPVQIGLIDSKGENGNYFHVYFYYPKENQIMHTLIWQDDKNKTTFAFDAVNEGLILGKWKNINKDFSRSENKEQIKKFEERILNKLRY